MRIGASLQSIANEHERKILLQQKGQQETPSDWQKLPPEASATLIKNMDGTFSTI